MTKPEPARAAATTILESYEGLIGRANVADSGEARIGACLILTIFEQFRAALCLVDAGHASHAADRGQSAGEHRLRTARFTDLAEGEVNAVAEEAKRVWEAGQAEHHA